MERHGEEKRKKDGRKEKVTGEERKRERERGKF